MTLAIDTETTGLDFRHGSRPFFVTTCDGKGNLEFFEWDVDPLTRRPDVPPEDVAYIRNLIAVSDELILHNAKFDVTALATLDARIGAEWPWFKTHDTILLAHLLASNRPKNLTDLAVMYLGKDISGLEKGLEEAVKDCRRKVQQAKLKEKRLQAHFDDKAARDKEGYLENELAGWAIAEDDREDMPSGGGWKGDYWLPRAYAKYMWESGAGDDWAPPAEHADLAKVHPYWTVLRDYANADTGTTMALYQVLRRLVRERGLEKIYAVRRRIPGLTYDMEETGVTGSVERLDELTADYRERTDAAGRRCVNIAGSMGHDLVLGKATNNSLRAFCFDVMKLEPIRGKKSKTDAPTLDKSALEHYRLTLPKHSKELAFIKNLTGKRKFDTNLSYMEQYRRFVRPLGGGYFRIHPSLNATGTDTLRWSSSNPNEQNIAKAGYECEACEGKGCEACGGTGVLVRSLRYCFGPAPGREWWSLDAKNIELRIPAYGSGEETLIDLFEKAADPPFYGSNHLANFSAVYPDLWEDAVRKVGLDKAGPFCKKEYASTNYQWCKNGGFAIQYGAVEKADGWGTADKAFHKRYAHRLLKEKFRKLETLNQKQIAHANKTGYVETMPDRTVDPARGYPLLCTRTEYGRVLETVPLSYHVQGTAMWWTMKAMIRVVDKLAEWRESTGFDGRLVMQVHDEIVLDFPKSKLHPKEVEKDENRFRVGRSNLWRIEAIKKEMERGGDDLGLPTPVGVEYHESNWGEGVTF